MIYAEIKNLTAARIAPLQKELNEYESKLETLKKAMAATDSKQRTQELSDEISALGKRRHELWRQVDAIETAAFKNRLAEEYEVVNHPKFEKAFAVAWDMGQSEFSEVEIYFDRLVELIR
jgi:predicted  nucleic acid-binding Zn-ribbon protein